MKKIIVALSLLVSIMAEAKNVEIQGHRGARGDWPENTLPAFAAAIEAGADCLELDLLCTADGEIVIHHDYFANPNFCAYLDGSSIPVPTSLIYSLTLEQVKQIDCGAKTNPRFPRQRAMPGTTIPTLGELLDMIANLSHPHAKKIRLNLEIKRKPGNPEYTPPPALFVERILQIVKKHNFSSRVYYSSFDPQILAEVRKQEPKAKLAFLFSLEGLIDYARTLGVEIISPEHNLIQGKDTVTRLHQLGFKVVVWTVNDLPRASELISFGVDGLITDYPEDFLNQLRD